MATEKTRDTVPGAGPQ